MAPAGTGRSEALAGDRPVPDPRVGSPLPWRPLGGRGVALLVVLGLIWGATFPVARVAIVAGASPFLLVGVDFLLATVAMSAVAAARGPARPRARTLAGSAGLGVLLIGGINLLLFWGIQFTTGGVAAIVFATAPLLSLVATRALGGRELLTTAALGAFALGLAGIGVLGLATPGSVVVTSPWGIVALAGGAVSQGVGASLVARHRPSGETPWGQAAQLAGGSAAGFVAWAALRGSAALPLTTPVLLSVLYVALLTGLAGYMVYFVLIREHGATAANLVTYLNPITALAVGVLALGEGLSLGEVAGLGLVLVALFVLQRSGRRARSNEGGPP